MRTAAAPVVALLPLVPLVQLVPLVPLVPLGLTAGVTAIVGYLARSVAPVTDGSPASGVAPFGAVETTVAVGAGADAGVLGAPLGFGLTLTRAELTLCAELPDEVQATSAIEVTATTVPATSRCITSVSRVPVDRAAPSAARPQLVRP